MRLSNSFPAAITRHTASPLVHLSSALPAPTQAVQLIRLQQYLECGVQLRHRRPRQRGGPSGEYADSDR